MASGDDLQQLWLPNSHMRQRSTVPGVTAEGLKAILGYLKPRYIETMQDGRRVAELRADDLQRVAEGYACGECLAFFGRRFDNCPGCGHELNPSIDIVEYAPGHWQPSEGRTSDQVLQETLF